MVNETGSRKPASNGAPRVRHADLDPVRGSPNGPAACEQPHHEAGHTTAPDHMFEPAQTSCIKRGVHTRLTIRVRCCFASGNGFLLRPRADQTRVNIVARDINKQERRHSPRTRARGGRSFYWISVDWTGTPGTRSSLSRTDSGSTSPDHGGERRCWQCTSRPCQCRRQRRMSSPLGWCALARGVGSAAADA